MLKKFVLIGILTILLAAYGGGNIFSQNSRARVSSSAASQTGRCAATPGLNGIYRIDQMRSDKLYSVIEGASSNIPYGEQQQFFIDLAVRLTPPDLLAIECRGRRVALGSSRAPRVEFVADGVTRTSRASGGRAVRSRIAFEGGGLRFTSSGQADDNLSFAFTPMENGQRLSVTRRISAAELNEPVVIRTVYRKISDAVRWDVFDDPPRADDLVAEDDGESRDARNPASAQSNAPRSTNISRQQRGEADALRDALAAWIAATNALDIEKQMSFYAPRMAAFYLTRDASREAVRAEKTRVFSGVRTLNIRAEEPEIIFLDEGRTALMRFRKTYRISDGARSRSGAVVQELRWRRVAGGDWKIFSERDVRVLR